MTNARNWSQLTPYPILSNVSYGISFAVSTLQNNDSKLQANVTAELSDDFYFVNTHDHD